uniref:Casein kinase I n=1 Tax=Alexandrium monilatum TaxID=311494 RepID=A0A7S4SCY2_9DINO|mmetsp:Transcript_3297/g.10167  ORF Transcript_3297/g.10167 Transcript_3297/m.10167 type:complete len:382 (+) Transcript_3297:164-1309(+)
MPAEERKRREKGDVTPVEGKRRPDKVGQNYAVGRKLGRGSFGTIYSVVDHESGEELAVKVEKRKMRHSMLEQEAKVIKLLEGAEGIPRLHYFAMENDNTVMVIELLGPSLEDLFCSRDRRFSVKTIAMIAEQVITRLEWVHSNSYVHRDIKPENFLIGRGSAANLIYLIDYGLAKLYCDPKTQQHVAYKVNKSLTGTARYASVQAHLGAEHGRRDDLEAVGYMLLYFLRGRLPWQGYHGTSKEEKYARILENKRTIPTEVLCEGKPDAFIKYMRYCQSLNFDSKPDYRYLRRLFTDLIEEDGSADGPLFDWWLPALNSRTTEGTAESRGDNRTCHSSLTRGPTLGNTEFAENGSRKPPNSEEGQMQRRNPFACLCSRGCPR